MTPEAIADKMMENDAYSQWLGITIMQIDAGTATLSMTVRPDMLNGFGVAHGSISYALADSALAFASNSHGQNAVSIETSIAHTKAIKNGDQLLAVAKEDHLGRQLGNYSITITNQSEQVVALFKGTVFRKETIWE